MITYSKMWGCRMYRNSSGSVLAMILGVVLIVIAVAFVVLNFGQTISSHKVSQSACDAAALQAAKDLQKIVIDGRSGKVALVDDAPPENNPDRKPVFGINTLLGKLRYHALLAYNLNDDGLKSLAQQELQDVSADISQLRQTLTNAANGQPYKDKNGQVIDVLANAKAIYDNNISRTIAGQRDDIQIDIGTFAVDGVSNIPVPTPNNMASVPATKTAMHNGKLHYKAHTPIITPGLPDDSIQFGLIEEGPRLIDNTSFDPSNNSLPPDAVQVTARQMLKSLVARNNPESQTSEPLLGKYKVKSSACFGGSLISQETPSAKGTLVFHLPNQGMWPNFKRYGVDLTSLKTMIQDSKWQGSGTWTPANNGVATSTTNDALDVAFSHFIKDLSMDTDMSSIVKAYNYNLQSAPLASASLTDWPSIAQYLNFIPPAQAQTISAPNWPSPLIPMTLVWHPPSAYIFNLQGNSMTVTRSPSKNITLPTADKNSKVPFFENRSALIWQAGAPANNQVTWGIAGQDRYATESDEDNATGQSPQSQSTKSTTNRSSKLSSKSNRTQTPDDGSVFTMTVVF